MQSAGKILKLQSHAKLRLINSNQSQKTQTLPIHSRVNHRDRWKCLYQHNRICNSKNNQWMEQNSNMLSKTICKSNMMIDLQRWMLKQQGQDFRTSLSEIVLTIGNRLISTPNKRFSTHLAIIIKKLKSKLSIGKLSSLRMLMIRQFLLFVSKHQQTSILLMKRTYKEAYLVQLLLVKTKVLLTRI